MCVTSTCHLSRIAANIEKMLTVGMKLGVARVQERKGVGTSADIVSNSDDGRGRINDVATVTTGTAATALAHDQGPESGVPLPGGCA